MRTEHVVKDKNGKVIKTLGREKPSFRTLAREFGDRCKREGLALYRNEGDKAVLLGALHREETT